MTEAEPQAITPPPALGPPIIGTDPGSIAGIPQPVFASGSATTPATPISITGTPTLPPPQVGFGGNTPVATPPFGAGTGPTYTVPGYASGSGTVPTAASLFPSFSAAGPSPPIVVNATQNTNTPVWVAPPPLPLPTTPGTQPIIISTAPNIPQLPWAPGPTGLPVCTVLPAISGTTTLGSTLTATTGTWTGSPTSYAYEWNRSGSPIAGANSSTYVLAGPDVGDLIDVTVTATNAAGETDAGSHAVGPITATRSVDLDPNLDPELPPRPTPKPPVHRAPTKRR